MSCLDVMYQVFGPQPYFSSYSPYHHQKLALYSKMQDPQDGGSRLGPAGHPAIKEEDKELPPGADSYQPSVSSTLGSALSAPHTELPFPGDPYSSASLHSHLHQSSPDAWHPSHHHHHHHHHPYSLGGAIGTQSSAYPRPGVHEMYGTAFDPRYGSLLVPSVRPHHRLTSGSSVPGPSASPCDLGGKGESGTGSSWSGTFTGAGAEIGLNMDTARCYGGLCSSTGTALLS
ncbi:Transcription cofactor vestigial-like protein 2 [Larimichthys crocea]|uniref:Uncharacterized protein n=1 Tax=Larimichthys crocea TaxID=215358 RepID=A0ACD3R1D0_LARCR|nr:Transcription cofactor vestigial-like protein 2 [Larimichthys crocea]